MDSIILMYIYGDMYFFENSSFSENEIKKLKDLAKDIVQYNPDFINMKKNNIYKWEDDVCDYFIEKSYELYGIKLKRIRITHILRTYIQ